MIFILLVAIFIVLSVIGRGNGVPVVLFHEVNNESGTEPKLFEQYMKYIHEKKMKTFTAAEAKEIVSKKGKLPKNSLLVTFDDGYYDNYSVVFPILQKYNIKATIFLNSAYCNNSEERSKTIIKSAGQANKEAVSLYLEDNKGTNQYMSWEEMKIMEKSELVDIEAHTRRHFLVVSDLKIEDIIEDENNRGWHSSNLYIYNGKGKKGYPIFKLSGETASRGYIFKDDVFDKWDEFYSENKDLKKEELIKAGNIYIKKELKDYYRLETDEEYEKRVREEIKQNKLEIEEKLEKKVDFFAWPWGIWNKKARDVILKEGINGFFTCKRGTNNRKIDFLKIRRNSIRKNNLFNFKLRIIISENYFWGKIYELFSK